MAHKCRESSTAFPEVRDTVSERVSLRLRDQLEQLLKTLICASCKLVFSSPVSTCTLGHSNCYTCTTRYNQCGICSSDLACVRNLTIEAQLALVDVECGITLCTQRVKASNLYDHFAVCEFRPIHCQLPIKCTGTVMSGARIDCNAVNRFEDYVYHLTQVHDVMRFELMDSNGFYDFPYAASGEDFFRSNDTSSALTVPIPLLVGSKQFLLHSQLKRQAFMVWCSAMFSEEEAAEYAVTIQLIHRRNFDVSYGSIAPRGKFPRWEVRTHNYHHNKESSDEVKDRITMQPTLLRQYAEIEKGKWNWTILCNVKKRKVLKPDVIEFIID